VPVALLEVFDNLAAVVDCDLDRFFRVPMTTFFWVGMAFFFLGGCLDLGV
jgi:hypothetical protein